MKKRYGIWLLSWIVLSVVFFIGSANAITVDSTWSYHYNQGETATFVINGSSNQTNISMKVIYIHPPKTELVCQENNVTNMTDCFNVTGTSMEAMEQFDNLTLNQNGTLNYSISLDYTNGFEVPGYYDLIFTNDTSDINSTFLTISIYVDYSPEYEHNLNEINRNYNDQRTNDNNAKNTADWLDFKAKAWYWWIIFPTCLILIVTLIVFRFWWYIWHDEGMIATVVFRLKGIYHKWKGSPMVNYDFDNMEDATRKLGRYSKKQLKRAKSNINFFEKKLCHWKSRESLYSQNLDYVIKELGKDPDNVHNALILEDIDGGIHVRKVKLKNTVDDILMGKVEPIVKSEPKKRGRKKRGV